MRTYTWRTSIFFFRKITSESVYTAQFDKNVYDKNVAYPSLASNYCVFRNASSLYSNFQRRHGWNCYMYTLTFLASIAFQWWLLCWSCHWCRKLFKSTKQRKIQLQREVRLNSWSLPSLQKKKGEGSLLNPHMSQCASFGTEIKTGVDCKDDSQSQGQSRRKKRSKKIDLWRSDCPTL